MKTWIERKNIQIEKELDIPQYRESNVIDKLLKERTKVVIYKNRKYKYKYKYGSLDSISISKTIGGEFTDSDYMTDTMNINKYYKSEIYSYNNNSKIPYLYSLFIFSYSKYYDRITEKSCDYFLDKSGKVIGPNVIREKGFAKNDKEKFEYGRLLGPKMIQFFIGTRIIGGPTGIICYKKDYDSEGNLVNHYEYCEKCGILIFAGEYDNNNAPIFNQVCNHGPYKLNVYARFNI